MSEVELRYVAHVTALTGCLRECRLVAAGTIRTLIDELEVCYPGFYALFVDAATGQLALNSMIYYGGRSQIPVSVIDLDQPIQEGATITFW
jgi:hypothetical protein